MSPNPATGCLPAGFGPLSQIGGERRLTVADRDIAPTLLQARTGWPAVLRCWLPGWIHEREAFLDRVDAELARVRA